MKDSVLIIGAGYEQIPIIIEAKRQGYEVVAVDGNPDAPGLTFSDYYYIVSTRCADEITDIALKHKVCAVTSMITEAALESVYKVASTLNLPGPSLKSVRASTDKTYMRELFDAYGLVNPRFAKAGSLAEALEKSKAVGFPMVMKPADSGGQRGLFVVRNRSELERNFATSFKASVTGKVILEEQLTGTEYNVVAIVRNGRIGSLVVSERRKYPVGAYGIVAYHIYPSGLDDSILIQIKELIRKSVNAMKIDNGIVFSQIFLTSRGPMIIETAERIPGGVMDKLFFYVTGYDLVKIQLDIALGKEINLSHYNSGIKYPAVVVKFLNAYPGRLLPGTVVEAKGVDKILNVKGVLTANYFGNPNTINPLRTGSDRFYYIISHGLTREEAMRNADSAADILHFEVLER
ncbi:MAG: ATP-grasp domain-containing protein [Peptococcaceae bacterium]|nr:ATP-grasp domain-containing protein [Peptococcaceae bacterium]